MSLSKLSDSDVELLIIELWRNGRSLWDLTFANYFNADEWKAVLSRISQQIQMDGVATCESVKLLLLLFFLYCVFCVFFVY